MRLARLTGLEREKIQAELAEVAGKITELLEIIGSRPRRLEVMRDELVVVRAEIASPRKTEITDSVADQDDESLIEPGQMVVTITRDGFIKRTPLDAFRQQNRGGRGRSAAGMRGDDVVTRLVQRPHPPVGAVLQQWRQGVPREGLAPAGGAARRQGGALW